jgi:hypothetical protein
MLLCLMDGDIDNIIPPHDVDQGMEVISKSLRAQGVIIKLK